MNPRLMCHPPASATTPKLNRFVKLDPGWIQAEVSGFDRFDPLVWISETPWWPASALSKAAAELIGHLWRHSVAVGTAARWLARNAVDAAPDAVAKAGLLANLGCWAVLAVEPDWLVRWWREPDAHARHQLEVSTFGTDLNNVGRSLAERRGFDPLAIDASWLHGEIGQTLSYAASKPTRLGFIREAFRWADQTPFSLAGSDSHRAWPAEPKLRILVAEVQARCSGTFVAADATAYEERMTRQNAGLRLRLAAERRELRGGSESCARYRPIGPLGDA